MWSTRALTLGSMVALLALGARCPIVDPAPRHEHVLDRIGYGPDAWSRERIAEIGVSAYIEEQLHPETIDDSAFEGRIAGYEALSMDYAELRASYCNGCPLGGTGRPRDQLQRATLLRAIYSRRQLEAVLTDFWFDHFNVNAASGYARWDVVPYVRDDIRGRVFQTFEELLLATAQAPAMLDYLDNRVNFKEGYVNGQGVVKGINENYSREIMELHSLGVAAGFGLADVVDVARILTGWSTNASGFKFKTAIHDEGTKEVMNSFFVDFDEGMTEGERLLRFLSVHPATAERVCRLLSQRLVSESPPQALVDGCAQVYLATEGDLREVTRTLLRSRYFRGPPYRTKVKRPLVLVASAARALGAANMEPELTKLKTDLRALGEMPYEAGPPTGYPDDSAHWAGAGTLLTRFNFLHRLVRDDELGIDLSYAGGSSTQIVDALAPVLVPGGVSPETRGEIIAYLDRIPNVAESVRVEDAASLLLSSPEFLRH